MAEKITTEELLADIDGFMRAVIEPAIEIVAKRLEWEARHPILAWFFRLFRRVRAWLRYG